MRYNSNRRRSVNSCRPLRTNSSRRALNCGESYGWVVDSREAWDAYEMACDYMGKDYVDDQIVSCLGTDALSDCLAYIFRMNDFREWSEHKNEE